MTFPSRSSVDFLVERANEFKPSLSLPLFFLALLALYLRAAPQDQRKDLPVLNSPKWYQLKIVKQIQFLFNAIDELSKARIISKGRPFRLLTNTREIIVLPPSYAEALSREDRLSFAQYFAHEFDGDGQTAGLEPYSLIGDPRKIVSKLVKKRLTRSLNTIPVKMSAEACFAIEHNFGSNVDWQEVVLYEHVLDVIARMISRLFWDSDEVCRNERWLKIMKDWSINSVLAAFMINMAPSFMRPLIRRFSKTVHQARDDYQAARDFIEPLICTRRKARDNARAVGEAIPAFNDIVDWIDSEEEGLSCDPVALHMVLNVAAVHTTAALIMDTLLSVAADPSLIEPLQQELVAELRNDGCRVKSLNNLKLLDSSLKESLRLNPPGFFGMHREALQDMKLPSGLELRKGDRVFVDIPHMRDPDIYESPETYDIYRFFRMRFQPDRANNAPLVNTSPEYLAFGHGAQACPGRFFAAILSKVTLSHLLLKYDWKLSSSSDAKIIAIGLKKRLNPKLKILFKRRNEEFELN